MRIGIYGGSFNPVHNGHVHLAETVMAELKLDKLYYVPSKVSPHRSSSEYAPEEDRLEMLRLVCRDKPGFEVSSYELDQDRVSYSVYTVEHFRRKYPDGELFLLCGSDMLLSFDEWYRYQDILSMASLAVVSREEGDIDELENKASELRKYGSVLICRADAVEISSTEIRKKIRKNCDTSCYLDKNVVQYIRLKKLYR